MPRICFCLFASTPDIEPLGFIVKVLTGSLEGLARRPVDWGFDGIEFMPDPERLPDPATMERALSAAGAAMPVVNTGRMAVQGMALLHEDAGARRRSIEAFKSMLEFAGRFRARVGLGAARGKGIAGASRDEMDRVAGDVFD